MSACDCCEQFPILVVEFQSRSKFATLGNCGFYNEADDKYYFVQSQYYTNTLGASAPETYGNTQTKTYANGDCTLDTEYDPADQVDEEGNPNPPYDDGATYSEPILPPEYESEYTPEMLKDNVNGLLVGDFTEWGGQTPSAYRFFSNGQADYSRGVVQVRVVHPPTATGYLKVWLYKKEFIWDEDEEWIYVGDSEFGTYEWTGQPDSLEHSINSEENRVDGEPIDVVVEEDQKRYDVFVLKWSLIPDYVPSDPIFNEETLAYERPVPDCESNGVPTLNEDCPFRE
jgi:hypothetical protein